MPSRYPRYICEIHPGNHSWKGQCVECRAALPCPIHGTTEKYKRYCVECAKSKAKLWRASNPERVRELEQRKKDRPEYIQRMRELDKQANERFRLEILRKYSRDKVSCACCGVTDAVFLTLDHINGDGAAERTRAAAEMGKDARGFAGLQFYRWLRRQDFPDGYAVLCWNCNYAKHRLGACPHQTGRRRNRLAQMSLRL